MPDPVVIQQRDALAAALAGLTDVQIFVDRSETEPLVESERPGVVIRIVEQQFDWGRELGAGTQRHTTIFDLDFYEEAMSSGGITKRLAVMMAGGVALIAADRTLGGTCYDVNFRGATAELDATPDVGCAVLTLETEALTRPDDWTAIV